MYGAGRVELLTLVAATVGGTLRKQHANLSVYQVSKPSLAVHLITKKMSSPSTMIHCKFTVCGCNGSTLGRTGRHRGGMVRAVLLNPSDKS